MKRLIAFVLSLVMTAALAVPSMAAGPGAVSTTRAAASTTQSAQKASSAGAGKTEAADKSGKTGIENAAPSVRSSASRDLSEIVNSYNNPNGRVLSAAKSGMPRNCPEDSVQGIQACINAGVDIVAVSVQKTKDNQLVVMEDSALKRMCVNQIDRKTASGKVSNYTLQQMTTAFFLRSGRGGPNRGISNQRVPSLADAIRASKAGCMLYIINGWKYANLVNSTARAEDACASVIIGGAPSGEKAQSCIASMGTPICHIAGYYNDGETEGSAKTFVADSLKTGVTTVLMQSNKQYSSIFKESTMKKFRDTGRPMINATQRAFCGDYKDNIEGWESLIDSGYSIIETDYPRELATYISDIETYRTNLRSLIAQANAVNLSKYDSSNVKQLDNALDEADDVVNLGAVSRTKIDDARYDLQEALDALDTGEVVPKKKMNPVGVIFIVIVIVALLALAYFYFKKKRGSGKSPAKATPKAARKAAAPKSAGKAPQKADAPKPAAPAPKVEKPAPEPPKAAPINTANQRVVDFSGGGSPEPEKKRTEPKNDIPDPMTDPEDPTLKEIATKAGKEFKEEAGELTGIAKKKIRHSDFMKKARGYLGKEEPEDEDEETPPDPGTIHKDDDGLSLFDLYDDEDK